jgi:hypothetical protein
MKPVNRLELMQYFGATQLNNVWSWCAVNEEQQSVYFSVWTDNNRKFGKQHCVGYILQQDDWGINASTGNKMPARNDQDEKIIKVLQKGYKAYGFFVEAKDKYAEPREIKATKTSFIFSLEVEQLDNCDVIGYPLERIEVK